MTQGEFPDALRLTKVSGTRCASASRVRRIRYDSTELSARMSEGVETTTMTSAPARGHRRSRDRRLVESLRLAESAAVEVLLARYVVEVEVSNGNTAGGQQRNAQSKVMETNNSKTRLARRTRRAVMSHRLTCATAVLVFGAVPPWSSPIDRRRTTPRRTDATCPSTPRRAI